MIFLSLYIYGYDLFLVQILYPEVSDRVRVFFLSGFLPDQNLERQRGVTREPRDQRTSGGKTGAIVRTDRRGLMTCLRAYRPECGVPLPVYPRRVYHAPYSRAPNWSPPHS
jgi:hypothetical protein